METVEELVEELYSEIDFWPEACGMCYGACFPQNGTCEGQQEEE